MHLQRALAHPFQIDPPRQIEKRGKGPVAAPFHHQPHRIQTHILERAQSIDQLARHYVERGLRPVHAGRHIGQLQPVLQFVEIDGQLVGQMDVAVHDACHELHRVIGLQPRSLVVTTA